MNQHILPFSAPAFTLDNTVPAPHLSEPGFHALGAAAPRPQAQMTSSEEQTVRAIATQNTKAGAHARTILEMAYGEPATFEVERIEGLGERSAEIAEKEMGDLGGTLLECYPNPAQSVPRGVYILTAVICRTKLCSVR